MENIAHVFKLREKDVGSDLIFKNYSLVFKN
jgi:hypothetical protein